MFGYFLKLGKRQTTCQIIYYDVLIFLMVFQYNIFPFILNPNYFELWRVVPYYIIQIHLISKINYTLNSYQLILLEMAWRRILHLKS